jgi:hypothetical protein
VDLRHAAAGFGIGRALFGLGFLLAPRQGGRLWVGEAGTRPQAALGFRSIGVRDLALGAGAALATLRGGDDAPAWFAAMAIADLGDVAGTAIASGDIPRRSRDVTFAIAGGSALAAGAFAVALAD